MIYNLFITIIIMIVNSYNYKDTTNCNKVNKYYNNYYDYQVFTMRITLSQLVIA